MMGAGRLFVHCSRLLVRRSMGAAREHDQLHEQDQQQSQEQARGDGKREVTRGLHEMHEVIE